MDAAEPRNSDHIPSRRPGSRTEAFNGRFTRSGAVPKSGRSVVGRLDVLQYAAIKPGLQ